MYDPAPETKIDLRDSVIAELENTIASLRSQLGAAIADASIARKALHDAQPAIAEYKRAIAHEKMQQALLEQRMQQAYGRLPDCAPSRSTAVQGGYQSLNNPFWDLFR